MKLSKFFIILIIGTFAALIYVRQQVEATKIGYQINAQQRALDQMLDQRQILLYNVCNLKSPENLQESLCKKSNSKEDFKILADRQIIILGKKQEPKHNFFGITSLAEAKMQD